MFVCVFVGGGGGGEEGAGVALKPDLDKFIAEF